MYFGASLSEHHINDTARNLSACWVVIYGHYNYVHNDVIL